MIHVKGLVAQRVLRQQFSCVKLFDALITFIGAKKWRTRNRSKGQYVTQLKGFKVVSPFEKREKKVNKEKP